MGIGEAAVTILSESGVPTPVVDTKITPPQSRMGPADDVDGAAKGSPLWAKYGTRVDNQSAREILAERMAKAAAPTAARANGAAARVAGGGGSVPGSAIEAVRQLADEALAHGPRQRRVEAPLRPAAGRGLLEQRVAAQHAVGPQCAGEVTGPGLVDRGVAGRRRPGTIVGIVVDHVLLQGSQPVGGRSAKPPIWGPETTAA